MLLKKKITLAFIVLGFLSTKAQKVTSDRDSAADFSTYKSITFLGWNNESTDQITELEKERFHISFIEEFAARGFVKAIPSQADLVATLYLVIEQETSTSDYKNHYNTTTYSKLKRGSWAWANGYSTTSYSQHDYGEGTLIVDVYDNRTGALVWQAVATKSIAKSAIKREKVIPKVAKKIMKEFPVVPIK